VLYPHAPFRQRRRSPLANRSISSIRQVVRTRRSAGLDEATVPSGLTGDYESARRRFDHYLQWDESEDGQAWRGEWMDARADRVRALRACVDDAARFKGMIAEDIRTVRTAAKLDPDVQLPF
jgi:hypothetical protein